MAARGAHPRHHWRSRSLLRRIVVSASALGVLTIGVKLVGFLEKLFQARALGTSGELDAYLVAISVPTSMFYFAREVIEPTVLPIYLRLREEAGLQAARRFATTVGLVITSVAGLFVAVLLWRIDSVLSLLAPGLDQEMGALAARLGLAAFPGGVLFALSALTAILLNAHKRFLLPASGEVAMKIVLVLAFAAGVRRWGIEVTSVAFAMACAARLAVQIPALLRTGGLSLPLRLTDPSMLQAMRLAVPLLVGMAFSQLGGFADNLFGSRMGEGVISALSFGRKLVDVPLLIVSYSLSVVVFPYFADLHIRGDDQGSIELLRRLLRLVMLVFSWVTALTVPLANDLVTVVFARGAFDQHSVGLTTPIVAVFAAGMVPLAVESVVLQHFFARRDVLRPVAAGVGGVLVHVGLLAATWSWLGPAAMAASYVVSKMMKVAILLRWTRASRLTLAEELRLALRAVAVTVTAASSVWAVKALPTVDALAPLARLALLGSLGSLVFTLGAHATGVLAEIGGLASPGSDGRGPGDVRRPRAPLR